MKIFWKVIVAVIAFSLLGIMIVLGTAYIKSVERHTYLADNKVLSDKYVYEEFSNGKKRVKNRATQQIIHLLTTDRIAPGRRDNCPSLPVDKTDLPSRHHSRQSFRKHPGSFILCGNHHFAGITIQISPFPLPAKHS